MARFATSLNVHTKTKGGRLTSIGRPFPGYTELIDALVGEKTTYLLLSAVAHGHICAVQQIGYQWVNGGLVAAPSPAAISYLLAMPMFWVSDAAWEYASAFNWPTGELADHVNGARVRLRELIPTPVSTPAATTD